jgi:hypothetical protein
MIPAPNLDDRSFEDIVQEAIALIPKYCPEWTNHNPTDPGITLIELFAWMTEMVLYRLNKVTDKNYLAFLDLMGIGLKAPQPARALLKFELATKAGSQKIELGTQVATPQTESEEAIIFETTRELMVLPNKLLQAFSQFHDQFEDHSDFINGQRGEGFAVFQGQRNIERVLYLGDSRFSNLNSASMLRLNFTSPETVGTDFPRFMEWQYWNGRRWKEMPTSAMEFSRGEIVFDQIEGVEECEVDGLKNHWVRGILVEVPQSQDSTLLDMTQAKVEVIGEGVEPDAVVTNDETGNFIPRDLSKNFAPFGDQPKPDTILYLASDDYFAQPEANIRIEFRLSDPTVKDPPKPHEDLIIAWEFWSGKKWRELARTTPMGLEERLRESNFEDSTKALSQTGTVAFKRPDNMREVEIFGEKRFWLRARIVQGNFGEPGQYELDGDRWVWHNENPLRPPYVRSVRINYSESSQPIKHVLSYNDFHYSDHSDMAAQEGKSFQPFQPIPEESPTLYLGFDSAFPNDYVPLYINTTEHTSLDLSQQFREHLQKHFAAQDDMLRREQRVTWEYWNGKIWAMLPVTDHTRNFTQSGFIDFIGPKDFRATKRFGQKLFWMRARLEMGGFVEQPRINNITLNCVYALNHRTMKNELIGSSDGTPNQRFEIRFTPVLAGEELWVLEREALTNAAIETLKDEHDVLDTHECVEVSSDKRSPGTWVRWKQVESFYASTNESRHYKLEPITGEILFGNGTKGKAPPMGENSIVLRLYRVGGGSKGNIGAGTINTLKRSISSIDTVYNPYGANGGSNQESIEEVKERGPYVIRSRYRAVTQEDFEWLAMQASNSIARAACLSSTDREGEVTVIVIPKFDDLTTDYTEKLLPSTELIRRVTSYLDERRLVTTMVKVTKPRYVDISVKVDVIRSTTGSSQKIKRHIERALRIFLHPLKGGRGGKGWPFGRNVLKMDLYHVVEEIEGVEFVDQIRLVDEDRNIQVDQIKIGPGELPYLLEVETTEKSREKLF